MWTTARTTTRISSLGVLYGLVSANSLCLSCCFDSLRSFIDKPTSRDKRSRLARLRGLLAFLLLCSSIASTARLF